MEQRGTVWLVGMMGAGKTAVGAALARRLGLPGVDTDAEIERRAGRPVAAIFADEGEASFRKREREVIDEIRGRPLVAALGGGAIAQAGAARRMGESGVVVYLRARAETLAERVGPADARPLLAGLDGEALVARIQALLAERAPHYEGASVVVDTDDLDAEEVAEAICAQLPGAPR